MSTEFVEQWLSERKPEATTRYLGPNEEGIHIFDLDVEGSGYSFRLGIPDVVVEDEARLAERLMEMEAQGWLDDAGEKDVWVLVAESDVLDGSEFFGR